MACYTLSLKRIGFRFPVVFQSTGICACICKHRTFRTLTKKAAPPIEYMLCVKLLTVITRMPETNQGQLQMTGHLFYNGKFVSCLACIRKCCMSKDSPFFIPCLTFCLRFFVCWESFTGKRFDQAEQMPRLKYVLLKNRFGVLELLNYLGNS